MLLGLLGNSVLLLCSLYLYLCMSKLWAGSLKLTQKNHFWRQNKMKYLQDSYQAKVEDIYYLPECSLWAPQRQKPCQCWENKKLPPPPQNMIAFLSGCPFLPSDADGSFQFCLLQPAAVWGFPRRVWLISDSSGFGFSSFISGLCDGHAKVGWWL